MPSCLPIIRPQSAVSAKGGSNFLLSVRGCRRKVLPRGELDLGLHRTRKVSCNAKVIGAPAAHSLHDGDEFFARVA